MTVQERKDRWLTWVKSQVGYHETGNNITKYAEGTYDEQAYGFSMQGQPWCDFFVDYSFYICFSFTIGNAMLYQTGKYGGAAVANSMNFYKQAGAFYSKPEVGDQAIYRGANHTGAVVAVYDNGTFDCIDGNYSDAVTYRKGLTLAAVEGFGRPNWNYGLDAEDKTDISTGGDSDAGSTTSNGDGKFSKGDVVRVSRGAVCYDSGLSLANLIYEKDWVVFSQWNDRVVLNESSDGSRHIMTPIAAKYLTKVDGESDRKTDISIVNVVEDVVQEVVPTIADFTDKSPVIIQADQTPFSKQVYGVAGSMMNKIKDWTNAHIR